MGEPARSALCAASGVQLRPAFWAKGLAYCELCWTALDETGRIPWWGEEVDGGG